MKNNEIDFEYNVYIPSMDTVIYMQDGDGSQLMGDDYKEGYDSYVDYEIISGRGSGDGGLHLYKSSQLKENWTEMIGKTIKSIYDLDTAPTFFLHEIEKIPKKETLIEAMEAAGYHYDEINSDSDLAFNHEYGSVRFDGWYDVNDWLHGVVFDDPDVSDKVETILKGQEASAVSGREDDLQKIQEEEYRRASDSVSNTIKQMEIIHVSLNCVWRRIQESLNQEFPSNLYRATFIPPSLVKPSEAEIVARQMTHDDLIRDYKKIQKLMPIVAQQSIDEVRTQENKPKAEKKQKENDRDDRIDGLYL